MRRYQLGWVLLLGTAMCTTAEALEWSLDFADQTAAITLNTRITAGATWRLQKQDPDLLGKLNVPGQMNLCEDNCVSLHDNPEPNQRLVNAAGAFSGVNADDGDLNYKRGDIVASTIKVTPDLNVKWGEFLFRVRAIGYYDPVNVNFKETHNDTRLQEATSKRPKNIERVFAKGINLLDAYGQYAFTWGDRQGAISIGQQTIRWGESTLIALNSLAEINPPNAAIFRMPGAEISELFQPVPAAVLSTDLIENVSAELVYQFGWKKVQADPRGSFMADLDLIDGDAAAISLGQFGENPHDLPAMRGDLGQVSSDSAEIHLGAPHEPKGGGQYGARINYFADWLNGGTEMGLYYLKYHSRFPYATVTATDESCARDASGPTAALDAAQACNGFNGTLTPTLRLIPLVAAGGPPIDPLQIHTLGAYLEYPENITMLGFSFNTNIPGGFSLAGEFSYRPDMPLQVQLADVIFAGLQPTVPVESLETPADPTGFDPTGLGGIHFPSADEAIPSYWARRLGHINTDPNTRVKAHEVIPGFERHKVMQFDFTAIKAVSNNPFGADQIIFINEVGGTRIMDMPDRHDVQFQGAGPGFTSFALGADGTGTPDRASQPCQGNNASTEACHLTPTHQSQGLATAFSWGVRSITRFEYNDVIFGWSMKPTIIAQWDINGIAPFPIQNFVKNRKQIDVGTDINITDALGARIVYETFFGGGRLNSRADRDNVSFNLSYTF